MKQSSFFVAAVLPIIGFAFPLLGGLAEAPCDHCERCEQASPGVDQSLERFAEAMLPMLPEIERAKIVALNGLGSGSFELPAPSSVEPFTGEGSAADWADEMLGRITDHSMTELQMKTIRGAADAVDAGTELPPLCFAPGTPGNYVWMIDQLLNQVSPNAFQQIDRWQRTAISGPGLLQGDPTVITYSYVADGTFIPDIFFGTGNSQLFAWLNSLYGTPEAWQDLFTQVFAQWELLTGTSYVYEPNDDGSTMFAFTGQVGVRGDVRIGAMVLDGNSGVLAFNFFPENGDMIFDAFDSFYNNLGNNSLRMRNVIGHEHGHGLGMAHVCPANQTKLMEPFVSVAYDGPQLDDVLNGNRHYGDSSEPNDSEMSATDLGIMNIGDEISFDTMSLDAPDDVDFYKVSLNSPSMITFTVTPDADIYLQGPQTQDCDEFDSSTELFDYNLVHDLQINVYDSDDPFNPIHSAVLWPAGFPETMVFPAPEAREYFFEVFTGSTFDSVQLYRVDVSTESILTISSLAPTFLEPGVENTFTVNLNPLEQTVEPGSELLYYRSGPGVYESVPMVHTVGNDYTATLPAFGCDADLTIEFYMEASLIGSNSVATLPLGGASNPFLAFIGQSSSLFTDNFEADLGWNIGGTIVGQNFGEWERGVPAGDGSRGDPTTDGDGSGSCYLTGNGGPGSNTDVDGESTILNSPLFDVSAIERPGVSYWRWYDNTGSGLGSSPGEDVLLVEVSDDGGVSWFGLEVVGPSTNHSVGGWIFVEKDLISALSNEPGFDFTSSQIQFRFIASDLNNASVIEAAIDAVSVTELQCQNPNPVISLPVEPLATVLPGEDYVFEVLIDEPIDSIIPGTEMLAYLPSSPLGLEGGGGFIFAPLVHNGGNSYTATIPAQNCNPNHNSLPDGGSDVSYYLLVEGVITGTTTFPDLGSEALLGLNIGDPVVVRQDNFELDTGWTVSGGAKSPLDGLWERGVPLGDGSDGDPTVDADGSGSCFVTGNTIGSVNSDVDAQTILNSPIFDISGLLDPRMEYYRWYDNTGAGIGPFPGSDVMEVKISYDGGQSFVTLDLIGPDNADSQGGWIYAELDLDTFEPGTSLMQIRFIVSDAGGGSIIEAGIDGVTISGLACETVVLCPADLTEDGSLNFLDVSAFLAAFGSGDPIADFSGDGSFNFLDVSAFLAAFGAGCP